MKKKKKKGIYIRRQLDNYKGLNCIYNRIIIYKYL